MAITHQALAKLLQSTFATDEIEIIDMVGDNNHYEVKITSEKFNDIGRIAQHKLVMNALGSIVGNELHALSIKTYPKNK